MNKKVLMLLVAALLLTSAVSCSKDNGDKEGDTSATTTTTTSAQTDDFIVIPGTDSEGNPVTYIEPAGTTEPEADISEPNPTFTDVTKQVMVTGYHAKIRTSTIKADNNVHAYVSEHDVLDVTGESANWYRINYNGTPCYIAKSIVADYDVIQAFTPMNDEVEVTADILRVRVYPSDASEDYVRGRLTKGTTVTRVAVGEKWSRILFEVTSETETNESGNPKVEIKQYYVSNDWIKSLSSDTATDAESAN